MCILILHGCYCKLFFVTNIVSWTVFKMLTMKGNGTEATSTSFNVKYKQTDAVSNKVSSPMAARMKKIKERMLCNHKKIVHCALF